MTTQQAGIETVVEHIGTLAVQEGLLNAGDPCYFTDNTLPDLTARLTVPAAQVECYVTRQGRTVMELTVLWAGTPDSTVTSDHVETVAVDSGQVALFNRDALQAYTAAPEEEHEYLDVRVYRHTSGRTLEYPKDFAKYDVPIRSEGGLSMNDLNRTGEWTALPYSLPLGLNYNGVSHAHDTTGAAVMPQGVFVTRSGYGDGWYPVLTRNDRLSGELCGYTVDFLITEDDEDEESFD